MAKMDPEPVCVNELHGHGEAEDDGDFIEDPDQMTDSLPQPFRMINKVTLRILDAAWDVISERESNRVMESMRFKPPQYDCAVQLEDFSSANCIADSADGNWVFFGLPDGIAVIDTSQQSTCDYWDSETMSIVDLSVWTLDQSSYLITTLDGLGIVRLFAFCKEHLYLLCALNEMDTDQKVRATRCASASAADFTAVVLEDTSSGESWLEVYKLPHDSWLKELETERKKGMAQQPDSTELPDATGLLSPTAAKASTDTAHPIDEPGEPARKRSISVDLSRAHADRRAAKFSGASLQLRIRPPPASVTGTASNTPSTMCKAIDHTCDVIGLRANHLLSSQHLEQRQKIFEHLHPAVDDGTVTSPPVVQPVFHFMTAGSIHPSLFESTQAGQTSLLLVRWSGQHVFLHYSLRKQAKDVEYKPDVVWPLSDVIVASVVSPCSTYIAAALQSNSLIVWDKLHGLPYHVSRLETSGQVSRLLFVAGGDDVRLIVVCSDGRVYRVDSRSDASASISYCTRIADTARRAHEIALFVQPVHGFPELIITCHQNGRLFVMDVMEKVAICELVLPPTYRTASPWQPMLCVTTNGQLVYVKGAVAADEHGDSSEAVFTFTLRSFPTLDVYFNREPVATVHRQRQTLHEKTASLFADRIKQQSSRVTSLQERWRLLKTTGAVKSRISHLAV